jgi:hypothetical protein
MSPKGSTLQPASVVAMALTSTAVTSSRSSRSLVAPKATSDHGVSACAAGFDFAAANIVKYFVERFCSGVHIPNPRNRALYNKDGLSRNPIEQNKIPFAMVLVRMRMFAFFGIRCYALPCVAAWCRADELCQR